MTSSFTTLVVPIFPPEESAPTVVRLFFSDCCSDRRGSSVFDEGDFTLRDFFLSLLYWGSCSSLHTEDPTRADVLTSSSGGSIHELDYSRLSTGFDYDSFN